MKSESPGVIGRKRVQDEVEILSAKVKRDSIGKACKRDSGMGNEERRQDGQGILELLPCPFAEFLPGPADNPDDFNLKFLEVPKKQPDPDCMDNSRMI